MRPSFTTAARITSIAVFGCAFKVALLMLLLGGAVLAQETNTATTDGATPSGVAPGAPAGSFALSGFDNVNLYNGNLNFALPLLGVNGRGGARYGMTLNIERKWIIEKNTNEITGQMHYHPSDAWWDGRKPGYGPGVLHGRKSGHLSATCPALPSGTIPRRYSQALTRLTFTAPDGTEFELRDQLNNGQPLSVPQVPTCTTGIAQNRGRIFLTADGTSATFISDEDIFDYGLVVPFQIVFYPSGYLMLRDGARYRIDNGSVTWMRDRNGNKLTFTYDSFGRMISVTDSLNRQVTVAYDVSDVQPYGLCDQISYKGAGGASRIIRVSKTNLGAALRSGFALQTPGELFWGSDSSLATLYNPTVVSSVWLPDGNRRYQFLYNSHGELARVALPTGGAIEYDHGPGLSDNTTGGFFQIGINRHVYRRVLERRIYADGTTLESRQTYSRPENSAGDNLGYVIVDHLDASGALLARQRHYFHGSPRSSFTGTPVSYSRWKEGREYRTESFDANGATLLQRSDTTWQQPVDGSAWPLTQPETSDGARPNNPQITQTTTTLPDTNQVAKQTFSYDSNNNETDVWEYDFGPGAPPAYPTRHTHTDYLTSGYDTNTDIHLRDLLSQRLVYAVNTSTGAETLASHITYEYDLYDNSPNHAPLVDRPGISGLDGGFATGYTTRGNVTNVSRWLDTTGGWIHTYAQYDIAGNVVKKVDGRGVAIDFDFTDCFGSADDEARSNSGSPELGGQFSYMFPTRVINALGHTTYTQYDYYLGKPVNSEDANEVVSSIAYDDALDRPTQGIQARYKEGVGVPTERRQTAITYDDTNRVITTTGDSDTFNDNILTAKSYSDSLGRTWRKAAYEGGVWTIKDTLFDALGRVSQVSNPYRAAGPSSASPPSGLWTTTKYDALGRAIQVTTPDGAHVDTAYSGNQVTVTDPAGKRRRSETGAFGRLVKVTEDPDGLNYDTTYFYDALGNLRYVGQGTQGRWFAFDSLSRLIRVKNPEQNVNGGLPAYTDPVTGGSGWAMVYSYDANGNLTQRIDARGVVANYSYDAMNRNTGIDYINGSQTRSVRSVYDGAVNGKGRFFFQWTQEGGVNATRDSIESYDAVGRPLVKWQHFWRGSDWGTPYVTQQSYDLVGAVKTLTYPSGHTINYSHDQMGRLSGFSGNLGDGVNRNYATGIQYDAAGSMNREQFGTNIPLYHRRHYNNRGQLFDIRLGTDPNPLYDSDNLDAWQNAAGSWNRGALRLYYSTLGGCHVYGNGGTDNNGNLLRMDHHIPLDDAVSNYVASIDRYDYDPLNRLKSVTELSYTQGPSGEDIYQGGFRQTFLYDRWGNRTIDQANTTGGVNKKAYTVDAATNRLTSVDGVAMSYDAAGNQINDGSGQRTYNGENRMVEAYNSAGVMVSWYVYDAEGRRVVRTVGSQGTWQVYGIGGELLAEYAVGASPSAAQKEYGYRNGELLVVWDGGETGDRQLQWLVQDHLGSTRIVVDRSGSLGGVRRHDFAPFGEELFAGVGIRSASIGYSGDSVRQRFDGYEHDGETDLDYAEARYFSSKQGRFTSVDPVNESADLLMPQSWNRYAFVINNPLTYIDPSGTIWVRNNQTGKYVWIPDALWAQASKQTYNNGKTLYTPLKSSEMEFDSKKGRVRLDPRGPTNNNPSGYTIIGPNRGSGAGAMAIGAVAASQADSPVPGPGDVIAVGLLAVALYQLATYEVLDLPYILNEDQNGDDKTNVPPPPPTPGPTPAAEEKPADELISGSLKKSPSYHSELGNMTKSALDTMAKGKARVWTKLI